MLAPVILMILAGIVDLGGALRVKFQLSSAATAGSYYALLNADKVTATGGSDLAGKIAALAASSISGTSKTSPSSSTTARRARFPAARRRPAAPPPMPTSATPHPSSNSVSWGSAVTCARCAASARLCRQVRVDQRQQAVLAAVSGRLRHRELRRHHRPLGGAAAMSMARLFGFCRDRSGASAVEFALLAGPLFLLKLVRWSLPDLLGAAIAAGDGDRRRPLHGRTAVACAVSNAYNSTKTITFVKAKAITGGITLSDANIALNRSATFRTSAASSKVTVTPHLRIGPARLHHRAGDAHADDGLCLLPERLLTQPTRSPACTTA